MTDVNDKGTLVGTYCPGAPSSCAGFVESSEQLTTPPSVFISTADSYGTAYPTSINDADYVSGIARTYSLDFSDRHQGYLWRNGNYTSAPSSIMLSSPPYIGSGDHIIYNTMTHTTNSTSLNGWAGSIIKQAIIKIGQEPVIVISINGAFQSAGEYQYEPTPTIPNRTSYEVAFLRDKTGIHNLLPPTATLSVGW